jgi:hypothetical protein
MSSREITFDWLPAPLRARAQGVDAPSAPRRSLELAVLIVLGLVLLAATLNDTFTQVHINERLAVDKTTWYAYTDRVVKLGLTQGVGTSTDVACGVPRAGAGYRLCLVISGPTVGGVRHVAGGYHLPLRSADSLIHRSDCFGRAAAQEECPPV